jgi:aminocarboxymuconate-semialdehyde decarboxylase
MPQSWKRRHTRSAAPAAIRRRSASAPKIDMHAHMGLDELGEWVARNPGPASGPGAQRDDQFTKRISDEMRPRQTDPAVRLKDMDEMGVDIQVVSINLPPAAYWASPEAGLEIAKLCNERIAEFCAHDPRRLVGIGTVPMQDAALAGAELERCMASLGLRGAIVNSNVRAKDLGEAEFRPFWARAEALGAPILVHPQGFTHPDRLAKFGLINSIAQPLEEALSMASLIYEGVMDAHPKLNICICHGGGYLPYYTGRTDNAWRTNKRLQERVARPPSAYFERFWYDTVVFDRLQLEHLVERVGADKIMMGTDYPVPSADWHPVEFVRGAKRIGTADKTRIMGPAAAELFGIG